ncbi:MAG: VIT family protein [Gammaproteobacteria bacterium]|nr:VIT family protein [Gammaproteobacteria bacterium]MDH5226639.1 VIT family protein [Gammaproteobacteria bacterium]
MLRNEMGSWSARHLDPGTHMGEILFGLIMTLTFTLGAGMVIEEEGRAGAREMLVGILGCNLAWGIIDGVLYVLGQLFERGRVRRIGLNLRQAESEAAARQVVADEFDEALAEVTDETERDRLYQNVAARVRATPLAPNRVRRADLVGGLAAGWLVFACSFPAVLPFLVLDDPWVALRVSNAILLGLLFAVGWRAARHTLAKPWLAGVTFLCAGVLLVALAIPLGG